MAGRGAGGMRNFERIVASVGAMIVDVDQILCVGGEESGGVVAASWYYSDKQSN